MEESFSKLTITLSSTVKSGRYKLKHYEWPIERDTGKTVIVDKHHGGHKVLKNEILKVKATRRNDKFTELGFSTICFTKDIVEAGELLKNAVTKKLKQLAVLQINTIAAWESGCEIEKIK